MSISSYVLTPIKFFYLLKVCRISLISMALMLYRVGEVVKSPILRRFHFYPLSMFCLKIAFEFISFSLYASPSKKFGVQNSVTWIFVKFLYHWLAIHCSAITSFTFEVASKTLILRFERRKVETLVLGGLLGGD